jgi:hypothetical protein
MSNDTNAIQTTSKAVTPAGNDHDLELKSVGNGNFVGTYHRNAYGFAPRKEA